MIELTGILSREINLKNDKNGDDYYHSWIKTKDGSQPAFFFFRPNYDLIVRLVELKISQTITLKGYWSKTNPNAFIASDFYGEELKEQSFNLFESELF